MSALRAPGLGPIIGHTTHDSCRLWIQAKDPEDKPGALAENRRTVGVIGLLSDDKKKVQKAYYFRLQREFDRTGTFVMGKDVALGHHESDDIPTKQRDRPVNLKPDTAYIVRMATLSIDDPMPNDESLTDVELAKRLPPIENIQDMLLEMDEEDCEAVFRTFPDDAKAQDRLSFLLGSCRYPGLLWKIKEADRIFGPMLEHLASDKTVRFTLMVGDQIYADTLNRMIPIGLADTYEEFQERYKTALGSFNMRRLLRTAPSYMILDDHEIEDNWTQDRLQTSGSHKLFNFAIGAYMSYQWSHGPRTFGRLLYYNFTCGGYPFFVLDVRTQRFKDDELGLKDNHLLGRPTIDPVHPGQLRRFLDWLSEQQKKRGDVPKFVGVSSVFAPNAMDERLSDDSKQSPDIFETNKERRNNSDSWSAYPKTRKAILEHIINEKIQNVVFLSGDIHCSNIARMEIDTGPTEEKRSSLNLCLYDITSSAFYWPFPFADGDPNNYVHDSTAPDQRDPFPLGDIQPSKGPLLKDVTMNYKSWAFTQEDNFCRIDIDKAKKMLSVRYFDRDGDAIQVTDEKGKLVGTNSLTLASWD